MKTISKIYIVLLAAAISLGVYAQDTAIKKFTAVDKNVIKQINNTLSAYYDLKDALVAGRAPQAKQMAEIFTGKLAAVDTTKMTAEQKNYYRPHAAVLKQKATSISSQSDIEQQRAAFADISNSLYFIIKSFHANKNAAYLQYCPMALNDAGAYWLSDEEEIMNPYFGNVMLHCGSVEEEL